LPASFIGPLNIGTGMETVVVSISGQLRDAVGCSILAQHGPAKPGEQRRSCLDAGRAVQVLGWGPQMALKEGLQKTATYYRESLGR
jgi:UDP-glucose 4-epimerase